MTKEVSKWADSAMFESEAMKHDAKTEPPRVFLLQGTPDPLGSIVAFSAMYSGKVVRDKRDVTDEERRHHLEEMKKTKLKAPLEAVQLHWMIDGIHRGITHQVVRQRTAVFAQESLRFAVVDDVSGRVALPPSLAGTREPTDEEIQGYMIDPGNLRLNVISKDQQWRTVWEYVMEAIQDGYDYLVAEGMPQEDARGMLPTNITTRMNYATNLRNFQEHAGMRLCTQAQFEWRAIWGGFIQEMMNYCTGERCRFNKGIHDERCDNWQWREIAGLFKPVCYLTGKCEFGADVDRKCSIRSRVQANHEVGRGSDRWNLPLLPQYPTSGHTDPTEAEIDPIHPAEWLLDPKAAR